ncbi:uncharacterized protein K460DRAFT_405009 [Cucurbitaria berberidis CBS 394.84]|uniref:Uncharacterized protein n=1 Tax=Cucurbitaria berberidis CBS 394.84 TaxID=1168544 RepID=A0A9P4GEU9_9PLEO|nr:uncharacterized protein K460DRAFT_405009 [Cucurbitaria berberidis CBS 394.84]KAF1844728.1 hypothetical protein K460DRAFT_405009 [Cucurbitaria berberidis CBS 394.84]
MTLNTSAMHEVPWTQTNATRMIIANLQLAQVQTLRTTHLTLGAFSLFLALLMVHRIVSDARRAAALHVTPRKQRFSALQNVHSAETFPLALACGAVLQQIIFVAVQSTSLNSIFSKNCRGLAMITYPAIFVVGYITLVFGIEMAWRGFRRERFAPRGKWNTTICVGVVSFMLLLTWMPTIAWPMYNRCFGSLIWFPMRYDLLTLIILCVLVFSFLSLAALISIQLMRTSALDPNERISASRMTYFLIVAALIYILVIPVQVQSIRRDFMNLVSTSRVAEISLFSSGIVMTVFHLFLRTNAMRMVIRPMDEMRAPTKQKRPKLRFFGPSDLEMNISGPMALQSSRRLESRQGLIDVGPEKNHFDIDPEYFVRPERALTPASTKSQSPIDPTKWPLPPDVDETQVAAPGNERGRQSYSLFPTRAENVPRLPATVYDPNVAKDTAVSKLAKRRFTRRSSITNVSEAFDFLTKPKPLFTEKHRRDRSTDSSATVQIGLRFSLAPATLAAAKCTQPERNMDQANSSAPPLKRGETQSSGESLGLPIQNPSTTSTTTNNDPSPSASAQPGPSNKSPSKPRMTSPARTPAFPLTPAENSSAYLQAQREKVLPPPPPRTPRSPVSTPKPAAQPSAPTSVVVSGLRMNPITPVTSVGSPTASAPGTPALPTPVGSSSGKSAPSPTARIPLGAGTMSRSPPFNGWI